jgi:hypothetical protein
LSLQHPINRAQDASFLHEIARECQRFHPDKPPLDVLQIAIGIEWGLYHEVLKAETQEHSQLIAENAHQTDAWKEAVLGLAKGEVQNQGVAKGPRIPRLNIISAIIPSPTPLSPLPLRKGIETASSLPLRTQLLPLFNLGNINGLQGLIFLYGDGAEEPIFKPSIFINDRNVTFPTVYIWNGRACRG